MNTDSLFNTTIIFGFVHYILVNIYIVPIFYKYVLLFESFICIIYHGGIYKFFINILNIF